MCWPDVPDMPDIDPQDIFREQAYWNRPNQYTPGGSLIWDDDRQSAYLYLSPEQQSLRAMQQQMQASALASILQRFGVNVDPRGIATPNPAPTGGGGGGGGDTQPAPRPAPPRREATRNVATRNVAEDKAADYYGNLGHYAYLPGMPGGPRYDMRAASLHPEYFEEGGEGYRPEWAIAQALQGTENDPYAAARALQEAGISESAVSDYYLPQAWKYGWTSGVPGGSYADFLATEATTKAPVGGDEEPPLPRPGQDGGGAPPPNPYVDPETGEPVGLPEGWPTTGSEFGSFLPGLDIESLGPALPTSYADYDQFREGMEADIFEREMRLLRPELERGQENLREYLSGRGLPTGSEIAGSEWDVFNRSKTDLLQNAARGARIGAQEQMAQDIGLRAGIRGQTLSERLANIGASQNEYNILASMLGLSPAQGGAQLGSFWSPGGVDVMGPYNLAAQTSMYGQQQTGNLLGSLLGFGGNLGALALLGSTVAIKKNIHMIDRDEIMRKVKALPVYQWQYISEPDDTESHIGVLAEDWNSEFPTSYEGFLDVATLHGVQLVVIQELLKRIERLEAQVKGEK